MSATSSRVDQPRADGAYRDRPVGVRRSTETKASFKTTEFIAYVAVVVAIIIAGAVTTAGKHSPDVLRASQVWLYITIVSVGYMISRGLAKMGSREPYTD